MCIITTKCECFYYETPYISLLFCMFSFIYGSNKKCDMLSKQDLQEYIENVNASDEY